MSKPFREIVREAEFEEQLASLMPNPEEADDYTLGAELILAGDPQAGSPASADGSVWYLPMCPVRGRRVSLFYTFDENVVIFLGVLAHDDSEI